MALISDQLKAIAQAAAEAKQIGQSDLDADVYDRLDFIEQTAKEVLDWWGTHVISSSPP